MISYTKYSEKKFDILGNFKCYYTKELIEEVIGSPEKLVSKGKYLSATKERTRVLYRKEGDHIRVVTFYPVK